MVLFPVARPPVSPARTMPEDSTLKPLMVNVIDVIDRSSEVVSNNRRADEDGGVDDRPPLT